MDLTTEEGRAFYQERLALLGKLGFLLTLVFSVLIAIAAPEFFRLAPKGLAPFSHAAFLLTWLGCRRGKLSLTLLDTIDISFPIAICVTSALPVLLSPGTLPGQEWAMLMTLTNVLFARAVFVPSPPRRTLYVGLVAALPPAAAAIVHERFVPAVSGAPVVAISALLWSLCVIAITTLASAVIYGLQQKVREARQLGQYTLGRKLGEGGMGIVYDARHAMLRRPTAVKLLPPDKAGQESIRRFEREVQLTSRLSHPNTISIFDYGRTIDGVFYYAMEYLDGLTLQELVDEYGPQDPGRVAHILNQVAGSLAEAHRAGLIHRDVKPANVILCERGGAPDVAKVVDFGLVRHLDRSVSTSLTQMGMIAGTPLYLAPEAITAPDSIDGRSDLYALGAVGYYLLSGRNVFEGRSVLEVCAHHLHTAPESPSTRLGRPLPGDLEALLLSCLEKEPDRRPQSAPEFMERLLGCEGAGTWSERDARAWWAEHAPRARATREADQGDTFVPAASRSLQLLSQCMH